LTLTEAGWKKQGLLKNGLDLGKDRFLLTKL